MARLPRARISTDLIKAVVDGIRTIVTTLFFVAALIFLWGNWTDLTDLLHNLKRVEFAGAKAEFGDRSFAGYSTQVPQFGHGLGTLTSEEFRMLEVRGLWLGPVLKSANLLWVDPRPDLSNGERQFLESFLINVRLSTGIDSAFADIASGKYKFDLVVSTLSSVPAAGDDDTDRLKGPLIRCPVHWFDAPPRFADSATAPERADPLAAWNKKSNDGLQSGFILAEHIKADIVGKTPDIIFYTKYTQQVASACSDTVASTTFALFDSVFNHLSRIRWQVMQQYEPIWGNDTDRKPKPEAARQSQN